MTKIIYIPIEPLEERYTEQWYKYFPIEFEKAGYQTITIDGKSLINYVDTGSFLPMNSTVHYKNSQMQIIAKMFQEKKIDNGTIFFIADLEFWGIEAIRLMADINKINIKIYSFLHAASYTKEDAFEIAKNYQKYTEIGWVMMCDMVFVGSEYHKQAFLKRRGILAKPDYKKLEKKIFVSGNPIFKNEIKKYDVKKKNQIIISNRFDWEKRPNMSLTFSYIIKKRHPNWNIIVTTSKPKFSSNKKWLVEYAKNLEKDNIIKIYEGLSKQEYYKKIAESKIMLTNSIEENFGYSLIEAIAYNTYPLACNKLSHPELCNNDKRLLFNDNDEIIEKIEKLMKDDFNIAYYADKYYNSLQTIIDCIKQGEINE